MGGEQCEHTNRQSIVLIGLSGSGKSSIAGELSRNLGLPWFDLDREIEAEKGRSVAEIIRVEGIEEFRRLESFVFEKRFANFCGVVSLGGGAVLANSIRRASLESGLVVFIDARLENLASRLIAQARTGHAEVRPLLADDNGNLEDVPTVKRRLERVWSERRALYAEHHLKVIADLVTPAEVAELIVQHLQAGVGSSSARRCAIPPQSAANVPGGPVLVGKSLVKELGLWVRSLYPKAQKVALLSDSNIWHHWGSSLMQALESEQFAVCPITLQPGETEKRVNAVESIADEMLGAGIAREDVLVAVGGGVVGDVGGLVASLYMRGIGLVHVPTSLVAQVDSAVGGKTGVNLQGGKNILGTFRPGDLVLCDVDTLSTLPEREYRSGLAEVVKYGLIADKDFFEWLEQNASALLARSAAALEFVVENCVRLKQEVVAQDLTDVSGRRAILNFGHTFGHALERITDYSTWLHGEAVAIGMGVALRFGQELNVTPSAVVERALQLLRALHLPDLSDARESLLGTRELGWRQALQAEKKRVAQVINFVVVEEIGTARTHKISVDEVVSFIARLANESREHK